MFSKQSFWVITAGVLGFLGVALGAFGAHILQEKLGAKMFETFKTGTLYHLIHTCALFAIALYGNQRFFPSAIFFLFGIILFSFSLYTYSVTGIKFFALVTPFGGILFLIGWGLIVYNQFRSL